MSSSLDNDNGNDDNGLPSDIFKFLNGQSDENNLQEQSALMKRLSDIKTDLESNSDYSYRTESSLVFLWNYSDKTIVVPSLIQAGYPETILNWFTMACKVKEPNEQLLLMLLNIIHNISRHDDGVDALNSFNAINVVKEYQSYNKDDFLCSMILALLSTPEEIKNDRKRMNNVLDQLLEIVYDASLSSDYHKVMFKAVSSPRYHISEPLVVLVKLFNDDRTLDYIMQHAQVDLNTLSTVEFFVNLLLEFYTTVNDQTPLKQLTCTALVNILWSVSFQKLYQDELQGNQKFKAFIENIEHAKVLDKIVTTQYVPKYIENIRTAAGGILLNINATMPTVKVEKEQQHRHPSSTTEAVTGARVPALVQRADLNSRPMIMISYSHGDKDFCYQLHDGLKSKFDIWIDMNHRQTGDLWQKIAEGMDKSNVILCLVSETYCQSKSCRREVTYALDALDELEQPVIPLFLQQYKPPSWLKIRTSGLKYVRFRDIKQLESEKLSELVQMIEQNLSLPSSVDYDNNDSRSCAPSHYEPAAPPPTTTSTTTKEKTAEENKVKQETYIGISELYQKPVEQWNKNDVSQWFEYNEILVEIQDLYKFKDGSELLSYAPSLLADEKLQYQIYSKTFSKKNNGEDLLPHEYTKFVNALRKLYEKTIEKSKPVKVAVPADAKSQTCQIL